MADLTNQLIFQRFIDLREIGQTIGVHRVRLQTSSDTITVPNLAAGTTFANSVAQVREENERSVSLTAGNKNTVTIANGVLGDQVTIITRHAANLNFGDDSSSSPPVTG